MMPASMLMETLLLLAAAQAATGAALEQGSAVVTNGIEPISFSIVVTTTFDAFVATEETPSIRDLVRPAIFSPPDKNRLIHIVTGALPIS